METVQWVKNCENFTNHNIKIEIDTILNYNEFYKNFIKNL